jgi:uncharacterized cupredoxin-like copper-binding protein
VIWVEAQRLILLILLLVGLTGCSLAGSSGAREVDVTLTEFAVQASTRSFATGVPYHLLITNRGQVNHELRIAPPGVQGGPGVIASVDEMALQPGTMHTIEVVFPESAPSTGLEFACHLPAHYEFGMHLAVTVRETVALVNAPSRE